MSRRGGAQMSVMSVIAVVASLGTALPVRAEPPAASSISSSVKDAGQHFQRGVALYNETDYRAALIEFRRAYQIAPNAAVLYNIGETYYQLQNYAAALTTLERYLTESGELATHRQEVEQTIETLRARVGKLAITTNVADCEITVDDELVGRTPLREPLLVSIGHRKVTAIREGQPAETRFVDVAAGDTVVLSLVMAPAPPSGPAPAPSPPSALAGEPGHPGLIRAGWITTGLLGAGAAVVRVFAFRASRDLKDARDSYPVSRATLNSKSSSVKTLSLAADIVAAAAIVTAGITLTLQLSESHSHEVHLAVAPSGIQLAGTFP